MRRGGRLKIRLRYPQRPLAGRLRAANPRPLSVPCAAALWRLASACRRAAGKCWRDPPAGAGRNGKTESTGWQNPSNSLPALLKSPAKSAGRNGKAGSTAYPQEALFRASCVGCILPTRGALTVRRTGGGRVRRRPKPMPFMGFGFGFRSEGRKVARRGFLPDRFPNGSRRGLRRSRKLRPASSWSPGRRRTETAPRGRGAVRVFQRRRERGRLVGARLGVRPRRAPGSGARRESSSLRPSVRHSA